MSPGLKDFHSGERGQFLKLFLYQLAYVVPLLVVGEVFAYGKGWIGGWTLLVMLLLDVPATYLFARLLFALMDRSAAGIVNMALAGGNLPPDPAHSSYESLAARGFYREAAEGYRAHLAAKPGDHLARIKLADLYLQHLGDPAAAEQLYLEIRKGQPSPREERLATNLLIELYRKTGRRDRLVVELARFADRYRGTRAGEDAGRALRELKDEMARPD